MEHIIKVAVRDKIATAPRNALYICGNSDFVIEFDFDEEWHENVGKIARFVWNGQHQDVTFANNRCPVPVIFDAYSFRVGVYAGNLETTTAALVPASKSILCGTEAPAPALPSVYEQLEALFAQGIDVAWERANAATEAAERAETSETAAKKSEETAEAHAKSAMQSKESAATSEANASASERAAKASEDNAKASENAAKLSEENAKKSEQATAQNEQLLSEAVSSAETSAKAAEDAADQARLHRESAGTSAGNAKGSEINANVFANNAVSMANAATDEANKASGFMRAASGSATEAAASAQEAKDAKTAAVNAATKAAASAAAAKQSETNSYNSMNSADAYSQQAKGAKQDAVSAAARADAASNEAYAARVESLDFCSKASKYATNAQSYAAAAEASAAAAQEAAESVRDGEDGKDGKDGTSVTVSSVTESTEDGGTNVVNFSDGKKLQVRNGSKGTDGTSVTVKSVSESSADGGTNTVTFSDGKKLNVQNGSRGTDGVTPHIGANGNWFIGNTDTGISAGGSGGGSGGSAAQSDWNAAEGEPGYVLNRTHYIEKQEAVVVLPETTIETPPDNDYVAMLEPFELVEGRSYVVAWNGVEYECGCFTGMGYLLLGNFVLFGMTGNDEPFALMIADGMCIVMAIDGSETATISVTASAFEIVHKLEGKYLPEGVPYSEVNSEVILPETTVEVVDESAAIDAPVSVEHGKTYTVTYNGVEYQCEAIAMEIDSGVFVCYLGNIGAMGMGEDTGEPFAMGVVIGAGIEMVVLDGSTTVTISIVANNEIVKKIDAKYLPDGLPFAEPFDDVVFSDFPVVNNHYLFSPPSTIPIADYVYDVNWGGTVYECTARAYDNRTPLILLGNGSGYDDRDKHFPFTIAIFKTSVNGIFGAIMDISVIEGAEFSVVGKYKVNKLDERCLPDIPKTLVVTFTKVDGEYVPDIEQEIAWQTCADGGMVYAKIPTESNNGYDFIPLSETRSSSLRFITPIYYTGGWYYRREIDWSPRTVIGTKVTETLTRWNLSTLS